MTYKWTDNGDGTHYLRTPKFSVGAFMLADGNYRAVATALTADYCGEPMSATAATREQAANMAVGAVVMYDKKETK